MIVPTLGCLPHDRQSFTSFVKNLVLLQLLNLHICVTSRSEFDIRTELNSLAIHAISLHRETRQKIRIANVRSIVLSSEQMKQWREQGKMVVELSESADGM